MAGFEYISYKTEALDTAQTIAKLVRFEEVDKYRSFFKILPAVVQTTEAERDIVTKLLNKSSKDLIRLFKGEKKPHRSSVKKVINDCMKAIAAAEVNTVNKDFAYEMCWYLSDIAGLDMRKTSASNAWGYWDVLLDEVKVIEYRGRKTINKKT
ncbi:MAG TPA: hypothetical protein VK489_00865 [Ferruginibacter sp.]|nr:hypothetical protein [Ferruginibacter sp.]